MARRLDLAVRSTYHLVDARNLGLENSDGVADGRLLGGQCSGRKRSELLVGAHSSRNLG